MIRVSPFQHQSQKRIKFEITDDDTSYKKISEIEGVVYSETCCCLHMAYDTVCWNRFLKLDLPFAVQAAGTHDPAGSLNEPTGIPEDEASNKRTKTGKLAGEVSSLDKLQHSGNFAMPHTGTTEAADISMRQKPDICLNGGQFYIKMAYHPSDVEMIRSLPHSWWNVKYKNWVVKANVENLERLQQYFQCWDESRYARSLDIIAQHKDPQRLSLYVSPEFPGQFLVQLTGYRADVDFLKHIPDRIYLKDKKAWVIDLNPEWIQRIVEHYVKLGVKVENRIPDAGRDYLRHKPSLYQKQEFFMGKVPPRHQETMRQYTDVMLRQRYSPATMSNYGSGFLKYLEFLGETLPNEATADDANRYLNHICKQKISESLINTMINAIKFYYSKVVFIPGFNSSKVARPRKSRMLPTVLSVQEVNKLLSSLDNKKHVCILYTLYGEGLRLGEVLDLRMQDLNWDRNQLTVKCGKGKKDRVINLSETLKMMLSMYIDEYKPQYWLFEGSDREKPYSSRSVEQVVRLAAKKAGLTRKVTPHTLRHCFATHLLDNGVQLPFIQQLLGHKDIKTTMNYTHVTTAQLSTVVSPLDMLKRKL